MKYQSRPVIVDAVQWFKSGDHESVIDFTKIGARNEKRECHKCGHFEIEHGWINSSGMLVCPGDFVVTKNYDHVISCSSDVFDATYKPLKHKSLCDDCAKRGTCLGVSDSTGLCATYEIEGWRSC